MPLCTFSRALPAEPALPYCLLSPHCPPAIFLHPLRCPLPCCTLEVHLRAGLRPLHSALSHTPKHMDKHLVSDGRFGWWAWVGRAGGTMAALWFSPRGGNTCHWLEDKGY
eukprot:scaffold5640_cov30-Tisochrysis_lutea.AAC.2